MNPAGALVPQRNRTIIAQNEEARHGKLAQATLSPVTLNGRNSGHLAAKPTMILTIQGNQGGFQQEIRVDRRELRTRRGGSPRIASGTGSEPERFEQLLDGRVEARCGSDQQKAVKIPDSARATPIAFPAIGIHRIGKQIYQLLCLGEFRPCRTLWLNFE